ncbi:hypothetical protein [Neisseria yangbaofengii]|uniref:hypothetical protein n=1 Tax=Neisseria yangbaofengii TaxID=2709396 RepID=UPI0013EDA1EB|nr:hypothetical protein [Neisseria yangbaofengii]
MQALIPLNFDGRLESSELSAGPLTGSTQNQKERTLLRQALPINLFFFVFESVSG